MVLADRDKLADEVVRRYYAEFPRLVDRYGPEGQAKCVEDLKFHISYLDGALASGEPALFLDYVAWCKGLFAGLKIDAQDLYGTLVVLRDALDQQGDAPATAMVTQALDKFDQMTGLGPSELTGAGELAALAQSYLDSLLRGDRQEASRLVLAAADQGVAVRDLYLKLFQPVMREVGRLWQANRITVAQEHYISAATQMVMAQLYPRIFSQAPNGSTLVATCVAGELHEIGMRMVADLFEMEGWNTFYLGANTPRMGVVQMLVQEKADMLAISATTASRIPAVRELIATVRATPACAQVKILVGGRPFLMTQGLWQGVGADGWAADAVNALAVAADLTGSCARQREGLVS